MPNHIHLIIQITNDPVETHCMRLNQNQKCFNQNPITMLHNQNTNTMHHNQNIKRDAYNASLQRIAIKSTQIIPKIIKLFKASVKSKTNKHNLWFSWQSRYHDHLITNQKELLIIKNYIISNPQNWQKDKFYK